MKSKKCIKWTLISVVIILIAIQSNALINCEILTRKYYSDFEYAYKDNTMLGEMEYFKVLECDGTKAKVYYVSKGKIEADVLSFEKVDDKWKETGWDVIWSTAGSASEIIWPYWWHFIYGGF